MSIKHYIITLVATLCTLPLVSYAALTSSEQATIDSFVDRRAMQYDIQELDTRSQRIIDRIDFTFEQTTLNEYTTDILTYIKMVLEEYLSDDAPSMTDDQTGSGSDQEDPNDSNQDQDELNDSSSTQEADSMIAGRIQEFEEDEDVTILAGTQSQVVAGFEFNARLEPFELENLTLQSSDSDIQGLISQAHLYTADGVKLKSDRPDTRGAFKFNNIDYTLIQGTTELYIVIDTKMTGFNGNSSDDLLTFDLRIADGEATGEFSSTDYALGSSTRSPQITLQSVLVTDIRLVDKAEGSRVDDILTNGSNVIAIIQVDTADSVNNERQSPRDLDVILQTLSLQVSDSTPGASARNSLILERLDRSGEDIEGEVMSDGSVSFDFDSDDSSALITNDSTATYRLIAENVRLDNGRGAVKLEIGDVRQSLLYTSSDPDSSTFMRNTTESFLISGEQITD